MASPTVYTEISHALPALAEVKVYLIYDIFGLSDSEFSQVESKVFVDPVTDILHTINPAATDSSFAIEFLPGQYDQRADSAEQCVSLLIPNVNCKVRTGKLYAFKGLEKADFPLLKKLLINSVESREKNLETLELPADEMPSPVNRFDGFTSFKKAELQDFYVKNNFAFGFDDLEFIQQYFKTEQRDPTETELSVLDTYWSDHCRHTTFETELTDITFQGQFKETLDTIFKDYLDKRKFLGREEKPVSLMDLATVCAKYFHRTGDLADLVISEEINACTIEIAVEFDGKKEPWYLLFKNETHNHPTEIEPFGGASTCLGGAIRDPLSGRAFVYQAMRLSGAADVLESAAATLPGKLPQRTISRHAANGFSSYGNQIGLATTAVNEIYHEGYRAKRMEVGFVVGAVKKDWVRREKPVVGDCIVVLGGATGKDGVGGATGSSREQDETSIHTLSTEVQKGNPVEERKIQRLFRNPEVTRLIKKSNDFGAGGVSVAIGEIAESLDIDLDQLQLKYEGLNGTELAISESQERMAVVVEPQHLARFLQLCEAENIYAAQVASVTESGRMRMFWRGETIVDLSRKFLDTHGCRKSQQVTVSHLEKVEEMNTPLSEEAILAHLAAKNVASQKGLVEMFDSTVGGTTVLMPFGGSRQLTPAEGSAQTLPVQDALNVETVSLAAWGFDAEISSQNSLVGAAEAVVESVAKIVAMGGDYRKIRLSFQEYFEKLGTDPAKWGKPLASLLGAYDAQINLNLAAIGGKDSMSGTYQDLHVPPTLISFACAPAEKSNLISPEFKKSGNTIYWFQHRPQKNGLPDYQNLKSIFKLLYQEIQKGNVVSVKTVKEGGPVIALAKMCFGNNLGAEVTLPAEIALTKNIGGFILESEKKIVSEILKPIGEVRNSPNLEINGLKLEIEKMLQCWQRTFEDLFPTHEAENNHAQIPVGTVNFDVPNSQKSKTSFAAPRVFIPVFPGTNCEYETQKVFQQEGAKVKAAPLLDLNSGLLHESLDVWVKEISEAQILAFPGGFSAGDEPDGSAKFIVNVLKNQKVYEAISRFLERDGLILGICNGFQALIKSGLLPYGEIRDLDASAPTLAHNAIGRHISQMVRVKVTNDRSPWLSGMQDQTWVIPVSHGEGRFVASKDVIQKLWRAGQIATQYVTAEGEIAHQMPSNPNGSLMGIEGICSPDGRIFGRMGHPERYAKGLMKNIPEASFHNIFRNGVQYFK